MNRSRFLPRLATALTVAALGVTTLSPLAAPASANLTHDADPVRIDLPAALPTSTDIADAGFIDYGWAYMDQPWAEEFFVDMDDDPEYTRTWQETGYVSGYLKAWTTQESLDRGNGGEGETATLVIGAVYQFETDEGASDALALIDIEDPENPTPGLERVPIDLGDEATFTTFFFEDAEEVGIHSIFIREDNLIGEVSVVYGDDFWDHPEDELDSTVALAGMVDDGLLDILDGDTPNIGQFAPVYDDGGMLDFNDYLYRDGAITERYPGESNAQAMARAEAYEDANAEAGYRVIQPIVADHTEGEDVPHYGISTTFTTFATERDARTWLENRPDVLSNTPDVEDVVGLSVDMDDLPEGIDPDDVSAYRYRVDLGDGSSYYKIQVNIRVGNLGFTTYLESAVDFPDMQALTAAANDVLTAIDEGGCPATMTVPDALQDDANAKAEDAAS